MSLIERIYQHSPVRVQNALLSLYGVHMYRLRYQGAFAAKLHELMQSQWYSADQLYAIQKNRLTRLVHDAYENVSYYRKKMSVLGAHPSDVTPENLGTILPTVSKDEIRAEPAAFLAKNVSVRGLVRTNTSGTSGTPLSFYATRAAIQENYAFFGRFLRWAGVQERQPSATFAGRIFIPSDQREPPYWRANWYMRNKLFSSYHLAPAALPFYIQELERLRPAFIDSYPSAIYAVAKYVLDNHIRLRHRPRAIVTSSETLLDHQRQAIEVAFDCPVRDQYGSAEMVVFVGQCEQGRYHINPEYGLLEVVDQNGKPVAPGQVGELVCTGFLNPAMPLIRYRIGDTAAIGVDACPCGRKFPVLAQIVGRIDDVIVTPEGNQVGRLDPIFKGLSAIRETQIVQEASGALTVNIVPAEGYGRHTADDLVSQLRKRVGQRIQIDVQVVADIPRTAAGKFKTVVSRLSKQR